MISDRARVSIAVAVEPATAFMIFTEDIDRWWRRGVKFRSSAARAGIMHLEPCLGGRLFESLAAERGSAVVEVGRILVWEPPLRVHFTWRNVNFAPHEQTQVEVEFAAQPGGTLVTVTHQRLSTLRPEHPARHGLQGAAFTRLIGLWWGEQMTSFRLRCATREA